jgi:hypothetical protein
MVNLKVFKKSACVALTVLGSFSHAQYDTVLAPELVNLESIVGGVYRPANASSKAGIRPYL